MKDLYIVNFADLDDQLQQEILDEDVFGLDLKVFLDQLFLECEHGDQEHRNWLKSKFEDFYNKVSK